EQVLCKFSVPEKLTALSMSGSGHYCVGGGASGRIYVWQMATGHLLRMFDAHFKAVRVLSFSFDDAAFVSAGEDASVHVWELGRVVFNDESGEDSRPLVTFSGHSLPVTWADFGVSLLQHARVYSCSLDRTVKIWDVSSKELIATIVFPRAISCLVVDPPQMHVYAGAQDGNIYCARLYTESERTGVVPLEPGATVDPDVGASLTFIGHTGPITGLDTCLDPTLLISSSEDGTAKVWDIPTRQCLRTHTSKSKGPLTGVKVMLKPASLLEAANEKYPIPIFPVWRRHQHTPSEVVPGGPDDCVEIWPAGVSDLREDAYFDRLYNTYEEELLCDFRDLDSVIAIDSEASLKMMLEQGLQDEQGGEVNKESEVEKLRRQVEQLKTSNKVLRKANDELYQAVVGNILKEET
ncbi:Pre-rRNA-processing protein ipi3, partial [Irineochytrium annulatum]